MGNTPPTTVSKPQEPFKAGRKSTVAENVRPRSKSRPSVLQQLILRQDWQRVLIRVNLFPAEVRHYMVLRFSQARLLVLPLHLACALDPPSAVVEALLHHYVEAAALPIQTISGILAKRKRGWKPHRLLGRRWRRSDQAAFPANKFSKESKKDEQQVLLPKKSPQRTISGKTEFFSTKQSLDEINLSDGEKSNPSSSSSLSSKASWEQKKGVILQLSPSGGLKPIPIQTKRTEDTTASNSSSVFRVQWDLEPLIEHVTHQGELLPLHIACLYRASDKVVHMLVDSNPSVALLPILGMLPIHWVAAGWTLPQVHPPADTIIASPPKSGPLPLLKVLQKASPESLRVQSGNHGMTPLEYVEECLEEGEYKEACVEALTGDARDVGSIGSVASIVFVDSDDTYHGTTVVSPLTSASSKELVACITALIADHNWEQVLALVEDDPSLAEYWLYGADSWDVDGSMDLSTTTPVIWKRLAIHLACLERAPEGLITVLLQAHPDGAATADPLTGELPLHTAVRHCDANLPVVFRLLEACPEATMAVDRQGQVPLHKAVVGMAPYAVVEALIEQDPHSVSAVDGHGKTPMDYAKKFHGSNSLITQLVETVLLFQRQQQQHQSP